MRQSLPFMIGFRYLRSKRRNRYVSFITLLPALGIALGVMAIIIVTSLMNGFRAEITERTLGMASHGDILGYYGQPIYDWQATAAFVEKNPKVLTSAPFIEKQAMLVNGATVKGAIIRGVMPKHEVRVADKLEKASEQRIYQLQPGRFQILLGVELRKQLRVPIGGKVTLITPQASVTPAGILPRLKRFTVIGDFKVGMNEYDAGTAYIHMTDAQKLFRMQDVTGVRVKLSNIDDAPGLRTAFEGYYFSDWRTRYANFFSALETEKLVMFIILSMIVLIASFNIVSTLVMVVTDKVSDIAILRTLGLSPKQIMGIFMVQGTVIGMIGTLVGTVLGALIAFKIPNIAAWIETEFGIQFLPADVYYISAVPSDLQSMDVLMTALVSFSMTVLATLYPAWKASKTQPAEALRYE